MLEGLLRLQVMPCRTEVLKQRADPKTSRDEVWGEVTGRLPDWVPTEPDTPLFSVLHHPPQGVLV